jgi:hypothetical protein
MLPLPALWGRLGSAWIYGVNRVEVVRPGLDDLAPRSSRRGSMTAARETSSERRCLLVEEGVFSKVESADDQTLDMMWRIRSSDEYKSQLQAAADRTSRPRPI